MGAGIGPLAGPGIEGDIDMTAARCYASGAELLVSLQCDHADTVAQDYRWPSAIELMDFLANGPETARAPQ